MTQQRRAARSTSDTSFTKIVATSSCLRQLDLQVGELLERVDLALELRVPVLLVVEVDCVCERRWTWRR